MDFLKEALAILAVVIPGLFWIIRNYVINSVQKAVITFVESTKEDLSALRDDIQTTHRTQERFNTDIEWIKDILVRMENRILDRNRDH